MNRLEWFFRDIFSQSKLHLFEIERGRWSGNLHRLHWRHNEMCTYRMTLRDTSEFPQHWCGATVCCNTGDVTRGVSQLLSFGKIIAFSYFFPIRELKLTVLVAPNPPNKEYFLVHPTEMLLEVPIEHCSKFLFRLRSCAWTFASIGMRNRKANQRWHSQLIESFWRNCPKFVIYRMGKISSSQSTSPKRTCSCWAKSTTCLPAFPCFVHAGIFMTVLSYRGGNPSVMSLIFGGNFRWEKQKTWKSSRWFFVTVFVLSWKEIIHWGRLRANFTQFATLCTRFLF
jgi:hypothetical protein